MKQDRKKFTTLVLSKKVRLLIKKISLAGELCYFVGRRRSLVASIKEKKKDKIFQMAQLANSKSREQKKFIYQ